MTVADALTQGAPEEASTWSHHKQSVVAHKNDFSLLLYAKHACAFRSIVYMKKKKKSSMWITFKKYKTPSL